jgi:hypothetical protein
LEEDWDFTVPKRIPDPSASKPSDWVDEAKINDPTDTKPAGRISKTKFSPNIFFLVLIRL